jgi:hypothetical protein
MIMVTGNATCAIAKRNAILGGVPKAVWRGAYDAVESVIVGDVKTLVERRNRSIKAFAAFGVKPEEIYDALGIAGEGDITLEHIGTLIGMYSAIKNSESTVEEMFPKTRIKDGSAPKSLAERLNKLAGNVGVAHDPETGEVTAGSGNVFADIGLPNPEKELADAQAASEARRGRPPGSKNKPKEPESAPESALPVDEETAALLLAGTLAARVGHAEFKKWWGRLSAPDVERVEPHLEKLHAILAEKAANHGNE